MFHVKHYHVKHIVLYKIIDAKGTQRQKIDIRLLVYVRVYQLQCSHYFGYNIIITNIFQNVNVSRETLKRYDIKYHVLTFQIFK